MFVDLGRFCICLRARCSRLCTVSRLVGVAAGRWRWRWRSVNWLRVLPCSKVFANYNISIVMYINTVLFRFLLVCVCVLCVCVRVSVRACV